MIVQHIKILSLGLGLMASLSACGAHDVAELRGRDIDPSNFRGAVAEEYRKFVTFEADEMMDWPDANYFAAKALKVLNDPAEVKPEDYSKWNVDEQFLNDLEVGDKRLRVAMRLFEPEESAQDLARAITSFDCWIEQVEEGWQTNHIAACQAAFNDALRGAEAKKGIELTDGGEAKVRLVGHHDLDQSKPRADDLVLIQSFASKGWEDLHLHVHIIGHTDRSGSEEHNQKLSVFRALAVFEAIKATWPGEYTFSIEGLGETNPAFATADGVKDIRNRRTEALSLIHI